MNDNWLTVDRSGLAAQLVGQPKGRPLFELFQNAVDEDTTTISIELTPTDTRGIARLVVTDDSPEGFTDLADSWTFFKASKKAGDPEKRGRFNTGEKTVLALCKSATIISTQGKVSFNADGTRTLSKRTKRDSGTVFDALIRFTLPEIDEALADMRRVLVPPTVDVTLNGEKLEPRSPVRSFRATLETVVAFKALRRKTGVLLYEPAEGETPTIFEMDIPVVEHEGRWHINVMQKVPLNSDRDNVTPAYLRSLRTAVLNEMANELTEDDAASSWVTDAIPHATDDAARIALVKLHGEKAVVYDPSDPESNKQALEHGHSLVHGRSMGKALWETNRRVGAIRPAGKVFPSGILSSPDGKPPIPYDDWTEGMRKLARYTEEVCEHLLGFMPTVRYQMLNNGSQAWWGRQEITFNLRSLGRNWADRVTVESLDALLIHEFAHHKAKDHLTAAFYDECCRLGAKLRTCTAQLRP
jgi:hypothetical protein